MIGYFGLCSVLMKRSGTTELNDFYPIRPECKADVPATRFKPRVKLLFLYIKCFILCLYPFGCVLFPLR